MIYYVDQLHTVDDAQLEALLPYVSHDRVAVASRYRFREDRVQSVLAFILLRIGLWEEYALSQMPEIAFDDTKKPYLIDSPTICFNLSHCKKGIACGICDAPIGIDIQHYVDYKEPLAKKIMTSKEFSLCNGDRVEFTRIWSLKESYGKYLGCGIQYDMAGYEVFENDISKSYIFPDFVLSVSAKPSMQLVKIQPNELFARCQMLRTEHKF